MTIYTPDAIFTFKICDKGHGSDITGTQYYIKKFVDLLEDGDVVFDVGCGKWPHKLINIGYLCSERGIDVELIGIDKSFIDSELREQAEEYNIRFEQGDYREFLDKTKLGNESYSKIGWNVLQDAVDLETRVISAVPCWGHDGEYPPELIAKVKSWYELQEGGDWILGKRRDHPIDVPLRVKVASTPVNKRSNPPDFDPYDPYHKLPWNR